MPPLDPKSENRIGELLFRKDQLVSRLMAVTPNLPDSPVNRSVARLLKSLDSNVPELLAQNE